MRVTISKILNKTDLAKSESHGGLVVTKAIQKNLKDFFEVPGQDKTFIDRTDNEEFQIHYQDYTSNGTTPNDRVTPIGKYASKHNLEPGDILVLDRFETYGIRSYFIEYIKKMNSVVFAGKSKTKVDILNFEHLVKIFAQNALEKRIKRVSSNEFQMEVKYIGKQGKLSIVQNGNDYELYFDDEPISENNKYFELDTSNYPFILKKTETWRVAIEADSENEEANREADANLIAELGNIELNNQAEIYTPAPEKKADQKESKGRMVPARSKAKAVKSLARAGYQCEVGPHPTLLRKKSFIPYTEPHHLIPIQFDDQFEYSLDVEANIVSLCSTCHNKIHYGADIEGMIRQLWEQRKEELKDAGLLVMKNGVTLTVEILLSFYGVN